MPAFDFITNEAFRKSLESDFEELTACDKAKAWKAVHVLAGSIIEAVLIDHLSESGKTPSKDPLKMELAELIQFCKDEEILSQKSVDLSSVVRGYRNLIHPGRVIRLKEQVDARGASIAQALVEIIVEEVASRRRESYGYTADQIVGKISLDSSAISIIKHLLKKLNPHETERLLLKVIPDTYLRLVVIDIDNKQTLIHLENCFRLAFGSAAEDTKRLVALKYLSVLQEEDEFTVSIYEQILFRASDLRYFDDDSQRAIVKTHLIASMRKKLSFSLLEASEGIGPYLGIPEETGHFLAGLVVHIIPESDELRASAMERLRQERLTMTEETKRWADDQIARLRSGYEKENKTAFVKSLEELQALLGLPF